MSTRQLTTLQEQVLGYVESEGPVSVSDVASSLLITDSAARSRLATLERRGLLSIQWTGHHRGRAGTAAYVTTDAGSALAAATFGDDTPDTGQLLAVAIYAYTDGTFNRRVTGSLAPQERHLSYDELRPEERTAVDQARAAGGSATVGHVTVQPGKRLGVTEAWWV